MIGIMIMEQLEKNKMIERAELLARIVTEGEFITEKDKDIVLFWIRDLLEPIKEYLIDTTQEK
jgi:hypothetical protein